MVSIFLTLKYVYVFKIFVTNTGNTYLGYRYSRIFCSEYNIFKGVRVFYT